MFWDWAARIEDPGPISREEAAARYADRLRTAVGERLRGRTMAHLSGGMDSTAVALVARDLVGAGLAAGPLHTLSLVYDRLPKLARERPYIESALQRAHGFTAMRLPADDLLDYDAFADPPPHDEPYAGLWRLQMDRATVEAADAVGAATMLTGIGADEIFDVQPYFLADLLRRGRLVPAWRAAGRWARAYYSSRWVMLKTFGLTALARPWLCGVWGQSPVALGRQNEFSIPPWVRPEFARRHDLRGRMQDQVRQTYRRCPQATLSVTLSALASRPGDVVRWSVAAPRGIAIAHPFLDTRLLCLGLGLQSRFPPEPGRMKPLLADALRDLLPREITQRRAKGHFDEIYYLGLARNLPRLEALVREAPIDDLDIFDKETLIRQLE